MASRPCKACVAAKCTPALDTCSGITDFPPSLAISEGPHDYTGYTFDDFLIEFHKLKAYENDLEEYIKRSQLFQASLDRIRSHNQDYAKGVHTWWMSVNYLADYTEEELNRLRGHKKGAAWSLATGVDTTKLSAEDLPTSVDWRTKNKVTPVKNQGGCGSCWAFAATETVESQYAIASGNLIELAPQVYVSCMKNPQDCGGTGGCEGAIAELAFNYTKTNGIAAAANYPYTGSDSKCKQFTPAVKVTGYVKLPANDAGSLATAVATKGPIAISVAAGGFGWQLYGGGIMSGCTNTDIDHAVQAVGYGTDNGKSYWLVRNSWGAGWGEKGYIRLNRDMDSKISTDSSPLDGFGCKGGPKTVPVAGECGCLSDSAYPTGATAAMSEIIV